jgi:hypothetical protein
MISTIERMQQLYEFHRKKADGLMIALAALNEDAIATKKVRAKGILDAAITIDTQRVNGTHSPLLLTDGSKKSKRKKATPVRTQGKPARQDTLDFLALFSETEPRRPNHPRVGRTGGVAKLLANGYLKRKGKNADGDDLYLRTDKTFHAGAVIAADSPVMKRRLQTQRYLWKYSTTEPRFVKSKTRNSVGVLVQSGYLKAVDGGYIRTGKEFSPTHS